MSSLYGESRLPKELIVSDASINESTSKQHVAAQAHKARISNEPRPSSRASPAAP